MKKIVLMVAVVACVAFASQGVQASTVQGSDALHKRHD